MNQHEDPSPDEPPYWIEDSEGGGTFTLEGLILPESKEPSQQLRVFDEQKRQAVGAFNICCIFVGLAVVMVFAGIAALFLAHQPAIPPTLIGILLGGGPVFGAASSWIHKMIDNANTRLDRAAIDEKIREEIALIPNEKERTEERKKFLEMLRGRR